MILYHGTNADIEAIDLTKGLRYKDFGKGFYLTPERTTAVRMAQKKARLFGGEQAAQLLQDKFLDQQYYFGTERSLRYLDKTNVEIV
jgi:hypothetical protein